MIAGFSNAWKLPNLRERILFTLGMIILLRLGVYITLPGIDSSVVDAWIESRKSAESSNPLGDVGAMLNIFSGGGLQQCGIFALGIMPYISASILMQLMTAIVPQFSKLSREDGGRAKINQYTRLATIIIAIVQGTMLAIGFLNPQNLFYLEGIQNFGPLVLVPGTLFIVSTVIIIVAATMLLMWIGDQMTDRGIGNGTSLIITINIIAALPGAMWQSWRFFTDGENAFGALILVGLIVFLLLVIAAVITLTQATRRIAIQHANRVVGRKMYGGQTHYLPLKLNYSGVMPIIFASALLTLPIFGLNLLFKGKDWIVTVQEVLSPASSWYYVIAGAFIFIFSYFWVSMMFQPQQISEDLKKSGGYIPGVRPGQPTSAFLEKVMNRLTFAGSIFLILVFVLPGVVRWATDMPAMAAQFFGGTSLLILVGVVLDVTKQIETHLLEQNYEGFSGKTRGKVNRYQVDGKKKGNSVIVYLWVAIAVLLLIFITAQFTG